jgi:hypothetical protein
LIRAPWWLIGLLLVAAIGVGIYAYYTTPLPLGLGYYIPTPGGANAVTPTPTNVAGAGPRAAAGQPLVLGAASVTVQSVQRSQTVAGGPAGSFTLVDVVIQNAGAQPLTPQPMDFRLVDDKGRVYALDPEATRSANSAAHRRVLFDASVPPSSTLESILAFEIAADATNLALRVSLGYGELELPR